MNEVTRWQEQYLAENQELMDNPMLSDIKTVEDLAKVAVDLKAYQGRSMRLPGDEPTPEEKSKVITKLKDMIPGITIMPDGENEEDVKRFWSEVGVPDDADAYQVPADMDVVMDEDAMKQAVQFSSDIGHTTKQHEKFVEGLNQVARAAQEQHQKFLEDEEAKLKQHLGGAYDESMERIGAMVSKFQDKNVQLGDLNNAAKLFILNVANAVSGDPQVFKQINKPNPRKTPAELRLEAEDVQSRLLDRSITGNRRKQLLQRYEKIYEELDAV